MKLNNLVLAIWAVAAIQPPSAEGARLSLFLDDAGGTIGEFRLDIIWTMHTTDGPANDLDSLNARFNVLRPPGTTGRLFVTGIEVLPGWTSRASTGISLAFTEENLYLGIDDESGVGVPGSGTEFSTVIASVLLQAEGNVAGTEISFRHNGPQDPLPAAYDGPQNWLLRWQYEVTGPFQFDIGAGNPGDGGPSWPYHGYEPLSPVVVFPEPGSLAILGLSALALLRSRR